MNDNLLANYNKSAQDLLVEAYNLQEKSYHSHTPHQTALNQLRCLRKAHYILSAAISLNPNHAETCNNLGVVLRELKKSSEAEYYFRKAIMLKPDYVEAYNYLGLLLSDLSRFQEAEVNLRKAVSLNPEFPEAFNNLGIVLKRTSTPQAAEQAFRTALTLRPDYIEAYVNLALLLVNTRQLSEAEQCLRRALSLKEGFAHAEFLLGVLFLLIGNYSEGWPLFELRRRLFPMNQPIARYWRGEPLTGKNLLLFPEPGFGETIQYIRFAEQAAFLAKQTTVWIQPELNKLIANQNPKFTVYSGTGKPAGHFDYCCSLPSLPAVFNITRKTIPRRFPYVTPNNIAVARWHEILRNDCGKNKYKIGIVWSGNPAHKNDYIRSIPFDIFKELFSVKNINWVSLQVNQQMNDSGFSAFDIQDYSDQLSDFNETAALICNLDLVISVDTAVAHLTGALNKPLWLLLPFVSDWRWQLDGSESVWYSSAHIFRQNEYGNWRELINRVRQKLSLKLPVNEYHQ